MMNNHEEARLQHRTSSSSSSSISQQRRSLPASNFRLSSEDDDDESNGSASSCNSATTTTFRTSSSAAAATMIQATTRREPEDDRVASSAEETRDGNEPEEGENDARQVEQSDHLAAGLDEGQISGQLTNGGNRHGLAFDQSSQQQQQQHWQQQQSSSAAGRPKEFQRELEDVKQVELFGVKIVALTINGKDRLCLAQISNTLLKEFSYNEIHNRRVALGITCIQCTPIQLEMLRRAGAMPSSSRRCGMITMREAERLCRSFLVEEQPPELPENFYFTVAHRVNYGCRGRFVPARYISSRAKCIECFYCGEFYSPNKFIFHSHRQPNNTDCNPPDSPNINSWRKHIDLDWTQEQSQGTRYAWEDVKSLFNGGTRRRAQPTGSSRDTSNSHRQSPLSSSAVMRAAAGQRKLSSSSGAAAAGRFPGRNFAMGQPDATVAAAAAAAAESDDHDAHIDVECDQSPIMMTPTASQTLSSRGSMIARHFDSVDELAGGKPKEVSHHQQPPHHRTGLATTKRSLASSAGPIHGGQSKRSATSGLNRHQQANSILNAHQLADPSRPPHGIKQEGEHSHLSRTASLIGGFQLLRPTSTNQSRTGCQFGSGGLDFSSSAPVSVSRRPTSDSNNRGSSVEKLQPNLGGQTIGDQYASNGGNNPLMIAPDANFIHSQLYSQLMQTSQQQLQAQQQQQQLQLQAGNLQADATAVAASTTMDAQVALRHHLWTSLLANLQCNFAASNNHQLYSIAQAQQQASSMGAAGRIQDISSSASVPRASIDQLLLASYPQAVAGAAAAKLVSNPQTELNLLNAGYTTSQ